MVCNYGQWVELQQSKHPTSRCTSWSSKFSRNTRDLRHCILYPWTWYVLINSLNHMTNFAPKHRALLLWNGTYTIQVANKVLQACGIVTSDLAPVCFEDNQLCLIYKYDSPLAAGTDLGSPNCPTSNPGANCFASFLALHLTQASSAYLEVNTLRLSLFFCYSRYIFREHGSG